MVVHRKEHEASEVEAARILILNLDHIVAFNQVVPGARRKSVLVVDRFTYVRRLVVHVSSESQPAS